MSEIKREPTNRKTTEIRPLIIETSVNRYAEGSVLVKAGNTHVLCTASIETEVPKWMQGKGKGWISAEYSMLPRATHTRSKRDREKVSGRTQEIQRLIGRALRAMIDMNKLGERSILIDCDVLQADGGTRTASITGSCVALIQALAKLKKENLITTLPLIDTVSAISIGLKDGKPLVDLDYNEDSSCDVDMNFVMTGKGQLVEVQGTAEHQSFSREQLLAMMDAAFLATAQIREIQKAALAKIGVDF